MTALTIVSTTWQSFPRFSADGAEVIARKLLACRIADLGTPLTIGAGLALTDTEAASVGRNAKEVCMTTELEYKEMKG